METIERHGVRSVLDLGCGNGVFLRELAGRCETLVGIEPSETGIAEARKNCPQGRFYQLKLEDDPELVEEKDFDLAISTEVVEHLYFARLLPRDCGEVLKKIVVEHLYFARLLPRFARKKLKPMDFCW